MPKYNTQRGYFEEELRNQMSKNNDIILLTSDLGYGLFDEIQELYPDRFINVGAAEQSMLDIAVGLSLQGKIPVCYSITPFLLYRGFETIRNYINYERIPIILIGSGRDKDYENEGFSHWSEDDIQFMKQFDNIYSYHPIGMDQVVDLIHHAIHHFQALKKPVYINLRK